MLPKSTPKYRWVSMSASEALITPMSPVRQTKNTHLISPNITFDHRDVDNNQFSLNTMSDQLQHNI